MGGPPWSFVLYGPLRLWPVTTGCLWPLSLSQPLPLPNPGEEWYQTGGSKNRVYPPVLIPVADVIWARFGERTKYPTHYWILFRIKHLCSEPMILNFWS